MNSDWIWERAAFSGLSDRKGTCSM